MHWCSARTHFHPRNVTTSYPNEENSGVKGQMGNISILGWSGANGLLFTACTTHCVAVSYRSEFNSCRDAGNKWLLQKKNETKKKTMQAGGRETGCFMAARVTFAVIFSILYSPLKISFTEVPVCIFIDVSLKAKCSDLKVGKLNVTQPK